jgi:hypothetical protein
MITATKVRFDPKESDILLDARVICKRAAIIFDQKARNTTIQEERVHFVQKTREAAKVIVAIDRLLENQS